MNKEKKVLLFATTAYMIAQFNKPNIELLKEMGYEVHVAANFKNPGPMSSDSLKEFKKYLIEKKVIIHEIPLPRNPINILSLVKSFTQTRKLMDRYNFTIIHSHAPTGGVIGRLVAHKYRKSGLKSIYTAHGFHFYKGAPRKMWMLYYPIEKLLSRITDVLITINKEDYKLSVDRMKAKENQYIPGVGVDTTSFSPVSEAEKSKIRIKKGYTEDAFILIYVGELSYRKNQEMLLRSIKELKNKIPNLKLLLVGTGPLKDKYISLSFELGIDRNVDFLGYRTDIRELMAIADIAVSTSTQEGLPVNVMEAMATGLPLVVTACRGNKDLVEHNTNGYVTEIGNIGTFSDYVSKLYENKELIRHMQTKSIEMISKYDVINILKYYDYIY